MQLLLWKQCFEFLRSLENDPSFLRAVRTCLPLKTDAPGAGQIQLEPCRATSCNQPGKAGQLTLRQVLVSFFGGEFMCRHPVRKKNNPCPFLWMASMSSASTLPSDPSSAHPLQNSPEKTVSKWPSTSCCADAWTSKFTDPLEQPSCAEDRTEGAKSC